MGITMYSTVCLMVFGAFFFQYNLSKKAQFGQRPRLLAYLGRHRKGTHWLSLVLVATALAILIAGLGLGSGAFAFVVVLMAVASLAIALAPLRLLRWPQVVVLYGLMVIVELVVF